MRRWLRRFGILLAGTLGVLVLVVALVVAAFHGNAARSDWPRLGKIATERLPEERVAARTATRANAAAAAGAPPGKQILFGDLHVHTSYSTDAMTQGLPILGGEGTHPPADACDFARFCSALDFWSINDHAESLTPEEWSETRALIRQCNDVAGDPDDPDLVSFLGWEWSQGGLVPQGHYGHKNVVLLGTAEDEVPARPIASGRMGNQVWAAVGLGFSLADVERWDQYADLHRSVLDGFAGDVCASGIDVRALPADCFERAETPDVLFEKLDQWDFPALVIPHGLAWGITNPEGIDLANQLGRGLHDSDRQRLIEVYSGHGNSEVFSTLQRAFVDEETRVVCPEPTADFEPCCWRAGEIVRARCVDPNSGECAYQVDAARMRGAGIGRFQSPTGAVLGSTIEDFGDCGQLRGAFLPAFDYRPRGSAQYALSLGAFEEDGPRRFRFGFLASSDNHRARAGSGYKEFGRLSMTDGTPLGGDWRDARAPSFYYTGGLVAVHAAARNRGAIFEALQRREVYGTSGDRILLWFDLLEPDGERVPMGGEARIGGVPRFEVRAVGAFEQQPGCPAEVTERLGPERLRRLCLDECYNPGGERRAIERVEIVRIRPQIRADEPLGDRIEDPWRTFACPPDPNGCRVTFEDPEFPAARREAVYYARAIQEPTAAVNGDPLSCERDADGRCVRGELCSGGGMDGGEIDDCLAPVGERAWSSPIFVEWAAGSPAGARSGESSERPGGGAGAVSSGRAGASLVDRRS